MELTSLNKDRKRKSAPLDMVYGKVPPQAKELEEWVLGACMMERSVIDAAIEIITPACFYIEAHKIIFSAIVSMHNRGMYVDVISVIEELKRLEKLDEIGGFYYVNQLTVKVTHTATVDQHCRIILQKYLLREMIRVSGDIIGIAYEDGADCFDVMDKMEGELFSLQNDFMKQDFVAIGQAVTKVVERVDNLRHQTEDITGVTSGLNCIDRVTYGWQPTDLIIIAARPSVGKTALALNFAMNAALHPIKPTPVGFFSLEMSTTQLTMRVVSATSEVPLESIMRGKMDDNRYTVFMGKGVRKMEVAPIYIDDTAAINIMQFRAKARRMVSKYKVGLIIIDYLQLMSGNNDRNSNREQEISNISRNLKATAKELGVPIIALSQLSRDVEKRSGEKRMPQLSDLRESGAIEQDADMVMFIYRPEYYDVRNDGLGENTDGLTEVRIAKHRNGSLETIKLKANLSIQKFTEWQNEAPLGNNWRPIKDIAEPKRFDDGFKTDSPF